MGVYIKGMEMPKNCDECRIMTYEDTNCISVHELFCGCPIVFRAHPQHEERRPDYCPLVEVPSHGRLIDADALQKKMIDYGWKHPDSTVHEFLEDDAPTIIEAEDSFFNSLKRGLEQAINGDVREITITESEE